MNDIQLNQQQYQVAQVPDETLPMSAEQAQARIEGMVQVLCAILKPGKHFGQISGNQSLKKEGAEIALATFNIMVEYHIEDHSTTDFCKYVITAIATHRGSARRLGDGIGLCSTQEERYLWQRASCDAEYNGADPEKRRIKYIRYRDKRSGEWVDGQVKQVMTRPTDKEHTILKMAKKRAMVDVAESVLPIREAIQALMAVPGDEPPPPGHGSSGPPPEPPQRRENGNTRTQSNDGKIAASQVAILEKAIDRVGIPVRMFLKQYKIAELADLPIGDINDAMKWVQSQQTQME